MSRRPELRGDHLVRRLLAAITLVMVSVLALVGGPSSAQTAAEFPIDVLAPVRTAGVDPEVAVTAIHRDPTGTDGASALIVRTATPIGELPDGARVSIVGGSIDGPQERVSLILEGGTATGEVAVSTADGFEPSGPADVSITPEGFARFPFTAADPTALVWAEVELPDGRIARTPPYPLAPLIDEPGTGALTAAPAATMYDGSNVATGEVLSLDAVPTLEVVNQAVIVRTTQPPPTTYAGVDVTLVQDFLRVAPDFSTGGQAPYFILIDYTDRSVTFFDGSEGLPVEVAMPESLWLVDGLTEDEVETSSVTFDRAGLLEAVGASSDAPVALGVTRRLTLSDGRTASAEGVLGTLPWFDQGSAGGVPTPTTATDGSTPATGIETTAPPPTATVDSADTGESGANGSVVIVAAVLAALLAGAAVWTARRNRRALADPDLGLGAMAKVVDKAAGQEGDDASEVRTRSRSGVKVPAMPDRGRRSPAGTVEGDQANRQESDEATSENVKDDTANGTGGVKPPEDTVPRPTGLPVSATAPSAEPDASGAGAVGVAGTRAALERQAETRAAAERDLFAHQGSPGPDEVGEPSGEGGRDALWAAMRRKAAEVGLEPDEGPGPNDTPPPVGEAPSRDAAERTVRPDDALDALNQLIDDLRLPGDD